MQDEIDGMKELLGQKDELLSQMDEKIRQLEKRLAELSSGWLDVHSVIVVAVQLAAGQAVSCVNKQMSHLQHVINSSSVNGMNKS